jgi:hypothetical protein
MARHKLALNPDVWLAARKPVNGLGGRWPSDAWRVVRSDSVHIGRFRVALSGSYSNLSVNSRSPRDGITPRRNSIPTGISRNISAFPLIPGMTT